MKKKSRKAPPKRLRPQRKSGKDESVAEIVIEISLPSTKLADTVYNSLFPETRQPSGFRSTTSVSRRDTTVLLDIKARDIVALRAASNSFLRYVAASVKTLDILAPFYTAETATRSKERLVKQP